MTLAPTSAETVLAELAGHEAVIERGLASFVEVGMSLFAIKKNPDLYRAAGYVTFEGYCDGRWNMGRQYGYRLIAAAATATALAAGMSPIGDTPRPTAESQVRPLARLGSDEEKREAWAEAVERSDGQVPTAATVEAVVAEMTADEDPTSHPEGRDAAEDEDGAVATVVLPNDAAGAGSRTDPGPTKGGTTGRAGGATAVPSPTPTREQIERALDDDGSIAALEYRGALARAIAASWRALVGFDAARLAEVATDDDYEAIERHFTDVRRWANDLCSQRPARLRVVNGGKP